VAGDYALHVNMQLVP